MQHLTNLMTQLRSDQDNRIASIECKCLSFPILLSFPRRRESSDLNKNLKTHYRPGKRHFKANYYLYIDVILLIINKMFRSDPDITDPDIICGSIAFGDESRGELYNPM